MQINKNDIELYVNGEPQTQEVFNRPFENLITQINSELSDIVQGEGQQSLLVTVDGQQEITGNKTFSGEVIVPEPTQETHAQNKEYVDQKIQQYVNDKIQELCIGINQTWVNVSSDRQIDVDYTNDTGRPIQVSVTGGQGSSYVRFRIIRGPQDYTIGANSIIVPSGQTYRCESDSSAFGTWSELR